MLETKLLRLLRPLFCFHTVILSYDIVLTYVARQREVFFKTRTSIWSQRFVTFMYPSPENIKKWQCFVMFSEGYRNVTLGFSELKFLKIFLLFRMNLLQTSKERMEFDGLNTLKYELKKITEAPLVTFVKVVMRKDMYNLQCSPLESNERLIPTSQRFLLHQPVCYLILACLRF